MGFELPQSQRLHQTLPGTKQRKDIQIVRIKQLQNPLGGPTQFGEPSMSNILRGSVSPSDVARRTGCLRSSYEPTSYCSSHWQEAAWASNRTTASL